MANVICESQASGTYRNQFNIQYMLATYMLDAPITLPTGEQLTIEEILNPSEKISVNFQSRKSGTIDIMSNFPLLALACLEGLKGGYMAYIYSQTLLDATQINGIQFRIPIFDKTAKVFDDGDILETSFNLSFGVLTLKGIDNPFAQAAAKPNIFRAQTILANNTQNVGFKGLVMIPNDTTKLQALQLVGTTSVQYQIDDIIAQLADEWVANLVPYQASDFLAVDMSPYRNVNMTAGNNDLTYYYVTQKQNENGY